MESSSVWRWFSSVLAVCAVVVAFACASAVASGMSWSLLPFPTGLALGAISCPSTSICTATGGSGTRGSFIERWNGSVWTAQLRIGLDHSGEFPDLADVSCAATSVCTAIGSDGVSDGNGGEVGKPFAEHWAGSQWSTQPMPSPGETAYQEQGSELASISCPTVKMCVAVGTIFGQYESSWPFIENYNGKRWSVSWADEQGLIQNRSVGELGAVSCASANFCIAVGKLDAGSQLLVAWNGRSWSRITMPPLPSNIQTDGFVSEGPVSCPTATYCVAAGSIGDGAPGVDYGEGGPPDAPTLEVWNGRTWSLTIEPPEPGSGVTAISCSATHVCTALGITHSRQVEVYRGHGITWSAQTITSFARPEPGPLTCPSQHLCIGLLGHEDTPLAGDVLRLRF
jgi:hypothetical protein